jgi:hypothetical protein
MSASTSHLRVSNQVASGGLLSRHPIAAFFLLAYVISWLIVLPLLIGMDGLGLLPYRVPARLVLLLIILSTFGPTFAALLMTARMEGWEGVRRLVRQYGRWKEASLGIWWCWLPPP